MKDKIFILNSCSTCQRILGELGDIGDIPVQNVKEQHLTEKELDYAAKKAGGYEALFNKRAMKYRSQGLNTKNLTEAEWKKHILGEYTFVKRPLAVINGEVYAGNSKKVVEALKTAIHG